MAIVNVNGVPVVHIRFEGRSLDIPLSDLDLGPRSTDIEIRQALARGENPAELPAAVACYIRANGLYGAQAGKLK